LYRLAKYILLSKLTTEGRMTLKKKTRADQRGKQRD